MRRETSSVPRRTVGKAGVFAPEAEEVLGAATCDEKPEPGSDVRVNPATASAAPALRKSRRSMLTLLRRKQADYWFGGRSAAGAAFLEGRSIGEAIKIVPPAFLGRLELIRPEKKVQQRFTQTRHFFKTVLVPRVGDRQIQKLQSPIQGQAAILGVVLIKPVEGPLDLAPDIGQLLHQGK